MTAPFAVVLVQDIIDHGANPAIVLAQIRYKLNAAGSDAERPWYTPPARDDRGRSELQRLTGLSGPQIKRAVAALVCNGALEADRLNAAAWDQKYSYRPAVPIESPRFPHDWGPPDADPNPPDSARDVSVPSGPAEDGNPRDSARDDSVPSRRDDSVPSSISKETEILNNPPTPHEGGEEQPRLFGDQDSGRVTNKERRRRQKPSEISEMIRAWYDSWWKASPFVGKGDKADGLLMFARCVDQGWKIDTLERRMENYTAARQLYRTVKGAPAPLMRAATFLNPRNEVSARWEEPWDETDLCYWPDPEPSEMDGWLSPQKKIAAAIEKERREGASHG